MFDTIENYYKVHSKVYDLTRWSFLFGRERLLQTIPEIGRCSAVLDVGCGTGYHIEQIARTYPDISLTGVDISGEMLHIARRKTDCFNNVKLVRKPYRRNLFPDHAFSLALCSYSLSMFRNPYRAVQNLSRHIQDGGLLAVVDFSETSYRWFNGWMKKNHVHFDPGIFQLLDESFETLHIEEHDALQGLWSYKIWTGRKIFDPNSG